MRNFASTVQPVTGNPFKKFQIVRRGRTPYIPNIPHSKNR